MSPRPAVLVVTGASSGIGRAVALQAAARGWRLGLVARGVPALEQTRDDCLVAGAEEVLALPGDVGVGAEVEEIFDKVEAQLGRPDVVVNAAGVVAYGRAEEVPYGIVDRVVRTNLLGSVHVASRSLRIFRAEGQGTLVLLGSIVGYLAVPAMTPYVISKWAVRALAHQLRVENRDLGGVHVVHVAPGGVRTPIYRNAANYADREGTPPPPAVSADRAAAAIMRAIDRPHAAVNVPLTNHLLRFGAAGLPLVYDRAITPLFRLLAQSRDLVPAPRPGNVLEPWENPLRK